MTTIDNEIEMQKKKLEELELQKAMLQELASLCSQYIEEHKKPIQKLKKVILEKLGELTNSPSYNSLTLDPDIVNVLEELDIPPKGIIVEHF